MDRYDHYLAPLAGSMADYVDLDGANLLDRIRPFFLWQDSRRHHGLWPFSRTLRSVPRTVCTISDDSGNEYSGINFASQDYLSLSNHASVKEAAIDAIDKYGVHSAGSSALLGNTNLSLKLEDVIAEKLAMEHVVLYPTGWGAGFGVIKGLVRENDYIVMDALSHACLQAGAAAATKNVKRFRHDDTNHLMRILRNIRKSDSVNGILVITESLFSMDSDIPDLFSITEGCKEYNATLVVDIAHDFGCMGPEGTGVIGAQGLLGKIDLVMGSFSKTFASNGGFVAMHSRDTKQYLKFYSSPQTFSNALSPIQAAVILQAFDIINSSEGEQRRSSLMMAITTLRREMAMKGIQCHGVSSPIVPVMVGREDVIRVASRELNASGILANLVEFPAVKKGLARFRFQVQAEHTPDDAIKAANAVDRVLSNAVKNLEIRA